MQIPFQSIWSIFNLKTFNRIVKYYILGHRLGIIWAIRIF